MLRRGAETVGAKAVLAETAGAAGDIVLVATTHGHWDHHRALADVLAASTTRRHVVGRDDAGDLPVAVVAPGDLLDHGDLLEVDDDLTLDVVHLRGHTPGSVALVLAATGGHPPIVITGDSLFHGGVGATGNDTDRFASLLTDVSRRLFDVLPDETVVLPGHRDGTTLGAERPALRPGEPAAGSRIGLACRGAPIRGVAEPAGTGAAARGGVPGRAP